MTGPLKLSIAMAVYNGERFIREQLESYLAQSRLPDEVVVNDNASTDRTREIVREFAARAPFAVKLNVNERNLGVARNFECAIGACTGDIVFLSDCDDVWLPQKLLRMEEVFVAKPSVGLLVSNSWLVDTRLEPLGVAALSEGPRRFRSQSGYHQLAKGFDAARYIIQRNLLCLSHNLAFRRTAASLFLPFPTALGSIRMGGHDFFIACVLSAFVDVGVIGEPLVLYRRHSTQVTAGDRPGIRQRFSHLFEPWGAEGIRAQSDIRELVALQMVKNDVPDRRVMLLLSAKSKFVRSRLQLWSQDRWSRIPQVAKELLMGRYHRFGKGFLTAGKDLVVRRTA
jgi:glycosyltransferase involved in cell wall biosynthesis